jgi:alkylation response protein AidB-like acyl-CoA dehydrogenase
MDLRPSDEQQLLIDSFRALYAKESPTERVRAAEPRGFDRKLWEHLVASGALSMAVAEQHGGGGAELLDLELVAEQHGRAIAAAPLIETQVAARLLSRAGAAEEAARLTEADQGDRVVTVALRKPKGGGPAGFAQAELVPAGAVASHAVVFHGDRLLLVPLPGDKVLPENMGSMPLADIRLSPSTLEDCPVLAEGPRARELLESALDDWLVLTAAALVGIAQRAVEIGVAYANERQAFGQKIGGFQAVGHRLADCASSVDGAELLTRQAAWAFREYPERSAEFAAMAFALAATAARDATDWVLHFHGGYGFMLEYDIQLYYRRARAWATVVMSPAAAARRVADIRYGRRAVKAS